MDLSRLAVAALLTAAIDVTGLAARAQMPVHYEPTIASLEQHPLPEWYADAKLGIFVHWGLYSVPGWAPLQHPGHDFESGDYIKNNPYAEWYYNSMRVPGSPTQSYQLEHYHGADYYDFTASFDEQSKRWSPDAWADTFRDAGARYVVLTTKHHEGFALWPTEVVNPNQKNLRAKRDIVGELSASVRKVGLKMGLYYSGGYDWTFNRGPIEQANDYQTVKPESAAYGAYADAQIEELIARYKPAVLWNDIDWPKSGNVLQVQADYYNAVPDGVVDDRFGIAHADFTSPEYQKLDKISEKKWEECRGLGRSFGYNRAEGEAETLSPGELITMLVDIVSKNGNLLLDVGPEADGTIPPVQLDRLRKLGAWMKQNGEAIYGTRPWTRAEGETADGTSLRFTRKGSKLFAILLAKPTGHSVTLLDVVAKPRSEVHMLGSAQKLEWRAVGHDLQVELPHRLPGDYAFVLEIESVPISTG
jgi:alpha-L-fucosidase